MNIIFDLDGTLIDASERLYQLFQDLVVDSTFTKNDYWCLKRNGINHKKILDTYFPNYSFLRFQKNWLGLIEDIKYLSMDKLYPETANVLKNLNDANPLFILTSRQLKVNVLEELQKLQIDTFFEAIFVTETKISKEELLLNALLNGYLTKNLNDLFISDVGKDIRAGNKLNYITVAITHGFMNKETLLKYKPDYIIDSLGEIYSIIDNHTPTSSREIAR